ncbi:MAG: pyridoxamine 5'-phosphate oxidase family protein [Gammaproteobacteria bacterium]|nr:pyridoxamine 5'-phosphate oxidase family protein [Gammaproteobacteria bacterium]
MAERFPGLEADHQRFIQAQHMFFVATVPRHGPVNLSPKGMDTLRIVDDKTISWLNLTGSGNETAADIRVDPRMTLMFCSFERHPLIMRVYGKATVTTEDDAGWEAKVAAFPSYAGARQLFELAIDLVQTSCGFAVPLYEFVGERSTLYDWSEKIGREKVREYWHNRNRVALNGDDIVAP